MTTYNEAFPVYESEYDAIYMGYKYELVGLITLLCSKKKTEYLGRVSNYIDFKKKVTEKKYRKNINKLVKKSGVINIGKQSDFFTDALLTAHLAVCCELFRGIKLPLDRLKPENVDFILENILGKYKTVDQGDEALKLLDHKLHSIDAFRTIQILKALGLYTRESNDVTQLSLGVGSGSKDLTSVHLEPDLKTLSENIVDFRVSQQHAKDVILVDGDPQRNKLFEELSNNPDYPIVAINDDAFNVLSRLPDILKEKGLCLRNTVIALRIDHRMIPDVKEFIRLITNSIDDVSDLIVTIGSGFNLDDYKGRTTVIQSMYDLLQRIGLDPVLLKLHGQGTLEEQWNKHAFGLKSMTTYQILYCKLKKNILIKKLAN